MSLTAFLRARLDEDEAHVRARWGTGGGRDGRDVAAKRALLKLHAIDSEPEILHIDHIDKKWKTGWVERKETGRTVYWCEQCDHDRDYGHISSRQEGCDTIRHLAAVYSDHPDYRAEWKP